MDRDPSDHPGGIPYKLLAEACIPSINVDDVGAIFEEHRVCRNLSVWQHSNQVCSAPFFERKKNILKLYLVNGLSSRARKHFKKILVAKLTTISKI